MSASGSTSKRPLPAAPGFRFRPTDDELVTYYLKRKIAGRPIRADAIGEVDLYKSEPWDLPSMSPLQSNGEWYFFTSLDRKYTNSFRTDRSTVHGYWKPIGEDCPVRRGTRIFGMKKTLTFHFGRAPRGQRTNWVMHEYRLEDEELITAGIQQDACVVCKIFQKDDSEPHSGASITEEKWEEAGDFGAGIAVEGDGVIGEGYLQLSDFEHNNDMYNQGERTALLTSPDGQNNGIHLEDPFLLEDVFEDVIHDMSVRGLQGNQVHCNGIDGNSVFPVLSHGSPIQNEAYLELNDLRVVDHGDYPSDDDSVDYLTMILQERDEAEEFFDTVYEDINSPILLQASPIVHGGSYVEQNDLTPADGHYPSDPTADDNAVFYDILNGDLGSAQGSFIQMSDILYSPLDDRSSFNMVDETMDYLVSSDNNLYYSALDSSEEFQLADSPSANLPNIFPEVVGSSTLPNMAIPSEANVGRGESASSSLRSQTDARSDSVDVNVTVEQGSEGYTPKGTLKRRIVNMLGSISAPPAFASELPVAPIKSTGPSMTEPASSIHVTTEMIQIHGVKAAGHPEPWSLPNSGDVGFFVSYGMASNVFYRKSVMLQGGLSLFFFSMLFLAICFKVGVWVCSR